MSESNVVLIKNNPWDAAIRECLDSAVLKGMKKPQLNIGAFNFTIAPPYGANPDFIYIKHKGEYIGKIKGARVSLLLDENDIDTAVALSHCFNLDKHELYAEAVRYGRETGVCSCCGRTLTNAISIALGIGPICREKFGFSSSLCEAIEL